MIAPLVKPYTIARYWTSILVEGRKIESAPVAVIIKRSHLLVLMGRWSEAETDLVRCREIVRPAANPEQYSQLVLALIITRINQGWFPEAQALTVAYEQTGLDADPENKIILAGYQGRLAFFRHDLAAAKGCFQLVLDLALAGGHRIHQSTARQNLGNIAVMEGDLCAAEGYYRDSLHIAEQLQDIRGMGFALGSIGICLAEKGEHSGALECFQRDLEIAQRLGELQTVAQALGNMGQLLHQMGRIQDAVDRYREQLAIAHRIGDASGTFNALLELASCLRDQGHHREAEHHYDQAIALGRQHAMTTEMARALLEKAKMSLALGRPEVARPAIVELLAVENDVRDSSIMEEARALRDRFDQ